MKKDEFIHSLLEAAQESGIPEAEVYSYEQDAMQIVVDKGEIEKYAVNVSGGVSLRGLIDGKLGTAYSEALDKDALVMLIRGVLESATLTNDKDEQFIFAGSPAYAKIDTLGDLGTTEERIDLALAMDRIGRGTDPRVTSLGHVSLQTERETIRIVNTNGLNLRHMSDACVGYVSAIARQNGRVTTGDGVGAGLSLADLDGEALAREAVQEAVFQLDAGSMRGGEMPVILRNTAMADLLGAFTGVFSADVAQKGLSLLHGREGERIAAHCVTLVDDPLLPSGLYSRGFDAEGVATATKKLIEGGTLHTLLHNLKTAKKAGISTAGNASRSGYAGPVGVAPSNLLLMPGEKSLAAMAAEAGSGLVVTGVEGLHAGTNAVSGDFSLLARGYIIANGKQAQPVEQVTIAGNLYSLLKDIVAVGNDPRSQLGHVCSPSVWVRSLSVAGQS